MKLSRQKSINKLLNIYLYMVNYQKKWIGTPLGPYKCFVTLCGQHSAHPFKNKNGQGIQKIHIIICIRSPGVELLPLIPQRLRFTSPTIYFNFNYMNTIFLYQKCSEMSLKTAWKPSPEAILVFTLNPMILPFWHVLLLQK